MRLSGKAVTNVGMIILLTAVTINMINADESPSSQIQLTAYIGIVAALIGLILSAISYAVNKGKRN